MSEELVSALRNFLLHPERNVKLMTDLSMQMTYQGHVSGICKGLKGLSSGVTLFKDNI